jgi:hypothetical protein
MPDRQLTIFFPSLAVYYLLQDRLRDRNEPRESPRNTKMRRSYTPRAQSQSYRPADRGH